jgi:hypothetical protein
MSMPSTHSFNTYNKPCFETAYLGENVTKLLKKIFSQKVPFLWATLSFKKITMTTQK